MLMAVGGIKKPWGTRYSGILRGVDWQLFTDVSELHIGPLFKVMQSKKTPAST